MLKSQYFIVTYLLLCSQSNTQQFATVGFSVSVELLVAPSSPTGLSVGAIIGILCAVILVGLVVVFTVLVLAVWYVQLS